MSLFLVDTDTVTFWLQGHTAVAAAFAARKPDEIGIPIIATEEIWDGWQAAFRTAKTPERAAHASPKLAETLMRLRPFSIIPWCVSAIERHRTLNKLKLNIGANDQKIAAIALDLGATVVTNHEQDFRRVPGLTVENWTLG
jgi:tRNA(fMet)-specific endonuclease VapC